MPSLVQPAGGDQSLYAYAGQRILAGDVMYRDVWDQKPPAIGVVYAMALSVWPHESVVPAADLVAAAGVAVLLILIGWRRYSPNVGFGAAVVFLLFGDPYLQRLSGLYVRGQCEPFISLAVTGSLALMAHPARRRWHSVAAGAMLAAAFWLKYTGAYALPVVLAAWAWPRTPDRRASDVVRDVAGIALGFAVVLGAGLAYFLMHGALTDLGLATILYNLRYSGETYDSAASLPLYMLTFPFRRAGLDMLWYLGSIGAVLLVLRIRENRSNLVTLAWLVAAVASIAINGQRGLPNYFMQAAPAMALAAAAGLAVLRGSGHVQRGIVAALLVVGAWRVGSDEPVMGMRLASLPGLVDNVRYDIAYLRGDISRDAYRGRFKGQKHDVLEIDRLVDRVTRSVSADERIFVFGFSGGAVCWRSGRASASRFFWSMPIISDFENGRPGYGWPGLLDELRARRPALVALQKEQWQSYDHFMGHAPLREWLEANYQREDESPMFSVWRRRGEQPAAGGPAS
jgi:hypothetical protein